VVYEIGYDERARRSIKKDALVQSEPLNPLFLHDSGETGVWLGVVYSVNVQIGSLLSQILRRMHARRGKRRGPLTNLQGMIEVRRVWVAYSPQGFDRRAPLWCHAHGRVNE